MGFLFVVHRFNQCKVAIDAACLNKNHAFPNILVTSSPFHRPVEHTRFVGRILPNMFNSTFLIRREYTGQVLDTIVAYLGQEKESAHMSNMIVKSLQYLSRKQTLITCDRIFGAPLASTTVYCKSKNASCNNLTDRHDIPVLHVRWVLKHRCNRIPHKGKCPTADGTTPMSIPKRNPCRKCIKLPCYHHSKPIPKLKTESIWVVTQASGGHPTETRQQTRLGSDKKYRANILLDRS